MADEVTVEMNDAAIRELFGDWNGPVGEAVQDVVDEIEIIARGLAPISEVGSKLSPPGFLKLNTRESSEHHYDGDGQIIGLVGAPRYPYNFIANPTSHKGVTANPRSGKRRGRASVRKADDDYLVRAIELAPEIVIGEPDG